MKTFKNIKLQFGKTLVTYEVFESNKVIARLLYIKDADYVEDIWVHPSHRRKGIATKLYLRLEKDFNVKLCPSIEQTLDGKALWNTRLLAIDRH